MEITKLKYIKYKTKYLKLKNSINQLGGNNKNLFSIIYFHNPCNDGLAAAWVAKKKFTEDKIAFELRPYNHGDKIDLTIKDKDIYFLDMAPSIDIYKKLKEKNNVYVLDHHKSNERDYAELTDKTINFDMNLSGVGLSWKWFYPKKEMPLFLKMIQGRDLFKFDYDNINEFIEALNLEMNSNKNLDYQFKILDDLFKNKNKLKEFINIGEPLLKQKQIKIQYIADKYIKNIYIYDGHKLCMVNVDSDLSSDLGNNLTNRDECDFAILWNYDHISEKYNVSMRSSDKVDVSLICKKFGGGGHPNASGCKLSVHPTTVFGLKKLN